MNTRHLVDPELLPALDLMPPLELSATTLPLVRSSMADMLRQLREHAPPTGFGVEERRIPGHAGAPDLRVLVYAAPGTSGPKPGYLYIHGGGYVMGSAEMFELQGSGIVHDAGCVVVSVDYRLSPETTHPGPLEDCYLALKWLHANAGELGVDTNRIAIGGESAGGGLAAALALLARDRGEVPVAFQHLVYPMIDDRTVTRSDPHPFAGEFIWSAASNRFGWRSLLGREPGSAGIPPYAAAARADDLTGLPPAFIAVGALDLFVDENVEFARRLLRAGVPAELHVYPGAYHGFVMAADADVSRRFRQDSLRALRRALQ